MENVQWASNIEWLVKPKSRIIAILGNSGNNYSFSEVSTLQM